MLSKQVIKMNLFFIYVIINLGGNMEHLAIMDKDTINKILNGTKTIESRFSKNKISPYHKVKVGDIVYLKEGGKEIIACFIVDKVIYFDNLNKDKVLEIKAKYGKEINADDSYFKIKESSSYGTLMYVKDPKRIEPITVYKKGRQGFISVGSIKDDIPNTKNNINKNDYDCDNNLHNFSNSKLIDNELYCSHCGKNVIDRKLLSSLSKDYKKVFKELRKDKWHDDWFNIIIDNVALNTMNIDDKDIRNRLMKSIYKYNGKTDRRQTPLSGNIIYYAQHATGTCCRNCLEKWYSIPKDRCLSETEINYFMNLIKEYIKERKI